MSSIFEDKIEFDGEKYRTPKLKEGFGFIFQKINELKGLKKEKGDNFSDISHLVLKVGIHPYNLKKYYLSVIIIILQVKINNQIFYNYNLFHFT